jgi:hypothetical protein
LPSVLGAGEGTVPNSFAALEDESSEEDDDNSIETVDSNDSGGAIQPVSPVSQAEAGEGENEEERAGPTTTKSGRVVQPVRLLTYDGPGRQSEITSPRIGLTDAEIRYYETAAKFPTAFGHEFCLVGAGLGGGFIGTHELQVMKFDEAMASSDAEEWQKAVDKEHERMVTANVFKATPREEVPDDATILTETWSMKKKSNGVFRARVTARGYEQIDGEHFDANDIAAPVVSEK